MKGWSLTCPPLPLVDTAQELPKEVDQREQEMSGETEGEDATPEAATGGSRAEGGQEFSVKEADYSEGCVKLKIGLGTKRTKKPPKILENYVCRPHIRTSLRPGRGSGSGSQGGRGGARNEVTGANKSQSPMRSKDRKDAMISDPNSSLASTALSCLPSPTNIADTSTTTAEAPVSLPAKRAPPKLAHKAGMKDHFLEGPPKLNQNGNKLSGAGKTGESPPSSSLSPTPAASPPSPTKQHSTVQEGAKVTNGDTPRDDKATISSQGSSSVGEKLNKRNATSNISRLKHQKARACKLHHLTDSHVSSVGNSAASSSPLLSCSNPALSDASVAPASPTDMDNDQGKLLPSSQGKTGATERDKAEGTNNSISLSVSNTGTSSTMTAANSNKSSGGKPHSHALSPMTTINSDQSNGQVPAGERDTASSLTSPTSGCIPNLSEGSPGSVVQWKDNNIGVDNPKDLSVNKPTVASEQMKVDSAGSRGALSAQGRRSALQQDCVPPAASSKCPSPEQDSRPLKKRKGRCPRWTRAVHQAQTPEKSASFVSNSSSPQQVAKPVPPRRPVGRPPKCSQFPVAQPKKRGRPRLNLSKSSAPTAAPAGPHKHSASLASAAEAERGKTATSSERSVTPPISLKRKRGRPKLLSPTPSSEPQPLKYPSNGDTLRDSPEACEGNGQSCSKGSGQLMMKSIIGKINKMRTKRRKWVLNQLLSGQGEGERGESANRKKPGRKCDSDPSPAASIPSLAASFGGKLGPQINVSKKGTIYIGKRRGRKPKVPNGDSKFGFSQDYSPSLSSFSASSQSAEASGLFSNPSSKNQSAIALNQSKALFSHTPSSTCASLFQNTSSFLAPSQKKSSSYREQHQLRHDRKMSLSSSPLSASSLNEFKDATVSPLSETLPSDSSIGTDNSMSDWVERAAAGGRDVGGVTLGRGASSLASDARCPRWTFGVTPHRGRENSVTIATGPARYPWTQPSRSPPAPAGDQREKHKHKSKGRVHRCSSYKLKGQKHRCKRKYLQLKSSRQDPDFMLEVEKLIARLNNIHLVHQRSVPDATLDGEGGGAGGGSGGGGMGPSRHSHPHHCMPQNLLPTIFQINFSGYYSPHLACPYDSLHYVRKPDLKKKHSAHPAQFREVSPSDVSLLQGLGFPLSQTGYYRTPHRIPYASPVGLGYYKRYPSSEGLYTQSEHSPSFSSQASYTHPHHAYPVFVHPSKLHKKKHKLMRQDCGGEGVRSPVMYPGFSSSESTYFWPGECKRKHRHRHVEHGVEERGGECDVAGGTDKTETRNPDFKEAMGSQWRHRYGSSVNRGFVPPSPAPDSSFSSPSVSKSCVFKEASLNWMGSSKTFQTASGGRGGFLHKPWLKGGLLPNPSAEQAEGKAGDSSLDSESEEDPELSSSSSARTGSVPGLSRPHHVNLFTNAFSQGAAARFGSLSVSSGSTEGISGLSRTSRRDRPTPSKSKETGREASPDSDLAEVLENGVHLQHGLHQRRPSLVHRHAHGYSSFTGQPSPPASAASAGLRGTKLSSYRQVGQNAGFPGPLSEPTHCPSSYGSRVRAGPECGARSSRTSLDHLNKILRAKKMQRQAVTGNNVVKKRGPGRPRKYPLPCPLPPLPTTTQDSHPQYAARGGGGVWEEVGPGPVKRGKKTRCYKRGRAEDREEEERHEQDRRVRGGGGGRKAEFPLAEHLSSKSLEGGKFKSQTFIGSVPSDQAPPTQSVSQWGYGIPQPPKKKYERAGLYSDVYKTDDPETQLRQLQWNTLEYIPGEHDYGLLPAPIHVGKYLRLKRIDFQLPYDIQWLWKHNQLHRKPDPPAYRKITSNVFVDVKPISEHMATQCTCTPPENSTAKGCVDGDCLNRRMCVECAPGVCQCGEQCANQALQRRQGVRGLERCRAEGIGWALRTSQPLRPGQFITEYLGEVVSQQEFRRRMTARRYGLSPQYSLTLTGGTVLDSHRMGSEARFIQHSSEPNCEVQKWSVNGIYRLGVFALRHINSGEELTVNYNTDQAEGQVCKYHLDENESPRADLGQPAVPSSQREEREDTQLQRPADKDIHTSRKQESSIGSSRCSPGLRMKTLPSKDREFVLTHGIFLVRNYEVVRLKQELLWREDECDRKRQRDRTKDKNSWPKDCHNASSCVQTGSQKQEAEVSETENLTHICKEICDIMTRYKDSAGHILAAPLLNLRARKSRRLRGGECESEPLDLSTMKRQIVSGQYRSLDAFDKDMLRVFISAEKYYGKKSAVGRDVCRLRRAYHSIRRNAAIQLSDAETGAASNTTTPGTHDCDPNLHSCHHNDQRDSEDEPMVQCEQGTQRGEVCFPSSLVLHSALDRMEAQKKRLDMVVWKLLQHPPSTDKRLPTMPPPSCLQPSSTQPPASSPCGADNKSMRAEAKRTEG
ncbi:histone-lysine N-methyltransferase ASH1L-like isoform X3 [Alosa pseudoharengus]|uniref:histone-lysine N-methyltransferase ASH1L-like isoform X3 n=1 Tax=Alosa pseudoharengus TaxID=34774 RepID=UPI003F8A365E